MAMPWQIFWQPPSPICEGRWHHGRYDGLKWRILAFLHGLSAAIWNWLYLAIVLVEASVLFLLLNMKLTWFFTFLRKLECELNSRILHFYSPPDVHLFDLLFFFFFVCSIRKLRVSSEQVHSRSILIKLFGVWVSCVRVLQGITWLLLQQIYIFVIVCFFYFYFFIYSDS